MQYQWNSHITDKLVPAKLPKLKTKSGIYDGISIILYYWDPNIYPLWTKISYIRACYMRVLAYEAIHRFPMITNLPLAIVLLVNFECGAPVHRYELNILHGKLQQLRADNTNSQPL